MSHKRILFFIGFLSILQSGFAQPDSLHTIDKKEVSIPPADSPLKPVTDFSVQLAKMVGPTMESRFNPAGPFFRYYFGDAYTVSNPAYYHLKWHQMGQDMAATNEYLPGIFSIQEGGTGFGLTDLFTRGQTGPDYAAFLYSSPLNNPDNGGYSPSDWPELENFAPFTHLQGQTAIGEGTSPAGGSGYYQVLRRDDYRHKMGLGLVFGTQNTQQYTGNLEYYIRKLKGTAEVSGKHLRTDGFRDGANRTATSGYATVTGRKYGNKLTGGVYFNRQAGGLTWQGIPGPRDSLPYTHNPLNGDGFETWRTRFQVNYSRDPRPSSYFRSSAFYQLTSGSEDWTESRQTGNPGASSQLSWQDQTHHYGGSVDMYHPFFRRRLYFKSGLAFSQGKTEKQGNEWGGPQLFRNQFLKSQSTAWAQAELPTGFLLDLKFHGEGQVRYARQEFLSFGEIAPMDWVFVNAKGGFVARSLESKIRYLKFYYTFTTTGSEPTRMQLMNGNDTLSYNGAGNPILQPLLPTRDFLHELGFQWWTDLVYNLETFMAKLTFYHNTARNNITLNGFRGNRGNWLYASFPLSRKWGAEMESHIALDGPYISLHLAGAWQQGQSENSSGGIVKPVFLPQWILAARLDYEIIFDKLFLDLGFRYQDGMRINFQNNSEIPGWTTLDASLKYKWKKLEFSLACFNITGAKYAGGYSGSDMLPRWYSRAPRQIHGGINYSFDLKK